MLVNSQLDCLRSVGIFKPVMFILNICFLQFEWHACELARCSQVHDHYKQAFDIFLTFDIDVQCAQNYY